MANFNREWSNLKNKFQHYNEPYSIEYFRTISFTLGRKWSFSDGSSVRNVSLLIRDVNPVPVHGGDNVCGSGNYHLILRDDRSFYEVLICTAHNTQSLVEAICLIMPMIKKDWTTIEKFLSPINWKNWVQYSVSRKTLVTIFDLWTVNITNFTPFFN